MEKTRYAGNGDGTDETTNGIYEEAAREYLRLLREEEQDALYADYCAEESE